MIRTHVLTASTSEIDVHEQVDDRGYDKKKKEEKTKKPCLRKLDTCREITNSNYTYVYSLASIFVASGDDWN